MKRLLAAVAPFLLLWLAPANAAAADCQFVLGFADMARMVSEIGQCKENQRMVGNGDAQQQTTGGLLVWRKTDNWTAFTDGYRTWLNGPSGLQQRLNTERLAWEPTIQQEAAQRQAEAVQAQQQIEAQQAAVAAADALRRQQAAASDRQAAMTICNQVRALALAYLAYGNAAAAGPYVAATAQCAALGLA